jgi:hypothetical protein
MPVDDHGGDGFAGYADVAVATSAAQWPLLRFARLD